MRDLNIDFMDLYKRTDRFIRDAYSSSEGVSEYIRLMEADFVRGNVNIRGWNSDYDNLKHIRWIRNQLAHEVSYDCDICSEGDYEWLEGFYKRLFSSDDPLAALRKTDMKPAAECVEKRQTDKSSDRSPRDVSTPLQRPDSDIKTATERVEKRQNYISYYVPIDVCNPPQEPGKNKSSGCLSAFLIMFLIFVLPVSILILILCFCNNQM